MSINSALVKLLRFLKDHEYLANWIQAFGVSIALIFGMTQVYQAIQALESSAENNKIALRNSASDLLVGINQAALSNPDAAGGIIGSKRLHLMRLHYFYRAYGLHRDGLMDENEFKAEENYLTWVAKDPEFLEVWREFSEQYRPDFQKWVNDTISNIS